MHDIQRKILLASQSHNLGQLTLRKISEIIGGNVHPQSIKHHLNQLKNKGFLHADKSGKFTKNNCSINKNEFVSIPILGSANCGQATMLAEEQLEGYLHLSPSLVPKKNKVFAIRAVGNSMNKASIGANKSNIEEGDYVLIDGNRTNPQSGDYVLSVIDSLANIKKFYKDIQNKQIVLFSESSQNIPPIFIHKNDYTNYLISGIVVNVIKNQIKV
ncbi:MAG: hypothetical protein LBE13_12290 [Bacteroidales bacterium]|jgi:SOS-response transcriptional repressor LexA|nr:hypothetical protein [Bacteroidales bacterium]